MLTDCSTTRPKSQALEAEWLSAVAESRGHTLLSIDCQDESTLPLCARHDIGSYPSLRLFKKGNHVANYKGPRRASRCVC